MKKFGVIFQYEIMNYIKNKSFMISTIVIAVLAAVILFLPSVFDMSGILGINKDDTDDTADNTEITDVIIICDEKDIFAGTGIVEGVLNDVKIENVSSRDALVDKIENDENVIAGFVVKNATDFEYVVNNSDMFDDMTQRFTYAMQLLSQYNYCKENNLDMAEIENAFNPVINSETTVLGKDMMSNYWYCYALIIIVFMVIILAEQLHCMCESCSHAVIHITIINNIFKLHFILYNEASNNIFIILNFLYKCIP